MNEMVNLAYNALKSALEKCYTYDVYLVTKNMERATVARIFYYMQDIINHNDNFIKLREYHIDLEYNKNGESIKKTPNLENGIQPDLLIHIRGTNTNNLLAVEFKSATGQLIKNPKYNNKPKDIIKLEDLTLPDIYNYPLGLFIKLNHQKPEFRYFAKGKEIPNFETTFNK